MIRFTTMISSGNPTPKNRLFREIRHLSRTFDKLNFFCQNEPNLNIWIFALSSLFIDGYAIFAAPNVKKNKPKQSQTNPFQTHFDCTAEPITRPARSYMTATRSSERFALTWGVSFCLIISEVRNKPFLRQQDPIYGGK